MPNYKLIYFDAKARAECSRMMFFISGQEFEDVRINFKDWEAMKPKVPFGALPVLEVDGQQFCQSKAIERHIASQFGLYGESAMDRLKIDQIADCLDDWINAISPTMRLKDDDEKKEARQKIMAEKGTKMLLDTEKMLGTNGHAVGNKFSWADIMVYNRMKWFPIIDHIQLPKLPNMEKIVATVEKHPKIKEYLAMREAAAKK